MIKTYEFAEGNYGESRENALRLSEMMQIIEETHIKNRCSDDGGYK